MKTKISAGAKSATQAIRHFTIVGIFLLGVVFLGNAWAQSPSYYEVDVLAMNHVKKKQNKSVVIGTISGEDIRIRGYGQMSDAQEFGPDENTIFEIGSISGVFTTTLTLIESQAGKFNLQARIDDYLPGEISAPMFRPFSCHTVDPSQSIFRSGDEDRIEMICDFDPFAPSDCISFVISHHIHQECLTYRRASMVGIRFYL